MFTAQLAMSAKQKSWIYFVSQHQSGFATPAPNDAVWIYSFAVHCLTGKVSVERELATTLNEVRNILGY